jgi:hypothetical protein
MAKNVREPNMTILIVEDDGILAAVPPGNGRSPWAMRWPAPWPAGKRLLPSPPSNRVDLVLMDIELAGSMNGITAAELSAREHGLFPSSF